VPFLGFAWACTHSFNPAKKLPASAVSDFLTRNPALSRWRQGSTYGLERSYAAARNKTTASSFATPYLYFAHSFYAPLKRCYCRHLRLYAALYCGARMQQHLRSAVPSREIGRHGLRIVRNFVEL